MTTPLSVSVTAADIDAIAGLDGTLILFATADGGLDKLGRRANRLAKGAIKRAADSSAFKDLATGKHIAIAFPVGLAASRVLLVKLPRNASMMDAREAGAAAAPACTPGPVTILGGAHPKSADVAFGICLRAYAFDAHKSKKSEGPTGLAIACNDPDKVLS